jgi:hypothetical protein
MQRRSVGPRQQTGEPLARRLTAAHTPLSPCPQGPINACPATCLNLGSFRVVFESAASCLCGSSEQYPALLAGATDTWKVRGALGPGCRVRGITADWACYSAPPICCRLVWAVADVNLPRPLPAPTCPRPAAPQYLVHALAALALMGLADLWLVMNLSAQYAHARRDLAQLRKRWVGGVEGAPRAALEGAACTQLSSPGCPALLWASGKRAPRPSNTVSDLAFHLSASRPPSLTAPTRAPTCGASPRRRRRAPCL